MNKLWLLLPLGLVAAPALAQSCVLTGTIKNIGTKPIVFKYVQQGKLHRDTVRAVNDRFTYVAKPSDDGEVNLFISAPRFASFWYEPGKLTVTGTAAEPGKLIITGTPENNLQDEYNRTVEWKYDAAMAKTPAAAAGMREQGSAATLQFVQAHPNARTSAHLLYWQMILFDKKPLVKYEQLFAHLTPTVRQSVQGQQAAKRLDVLRNQPTLGRPVPDFTVADTAGVKHSLATYRGQYVLLDFWGHWCGPCIRAMPKVKALHEQYAGKLAIIGMAMEDAGDVAEWKQAIRKHQVPGVQLSELQQANGPVITGYNITAFPTYLLLDPQGKLVARSNDVDEITKKLAALPAL